MDVILILFFLQYVRGLQNGSLRLSQYLIEVVQRWGYTANSFYGSSLISFGAIKFHMEKL